MNARLPVRRPVTARRLKARRGIELVSVARIGGLALMFLASLGVNALASADEFRLDPAGLHISGLRFTDEQLVRERLGFTPEDRPNLFRLRTAGIEQAVASLPTVASVGVVVALPDRLVVRVTEREPVVAWQTRSRTLLVDGNGALIAEVELASIDGLPLVVDRRAATQALDAGGRLDDVDLAAVLRLASITPALLGSRSTRLALSVDDADGWALASVEPPWRAVFGIYTANLRPPEANVDRQVQCLRALLAEGEESVAVAYLSVGDDRCGTVRDRPTPGARIFQNVGRQASTPGPRT